MSKRSPITPFDFADEVVESPPYSIDSFDDNELEEEEENNAVASEQEEHEEEEEGPNHENSNSSSNNASVDSSSSASTARIILPTVDSNGKRPLTVDDHDDDDDDTECNKKTILNHEILKRSTEDYNGDTGKHPLYNKTDMNQDKKIMGKQSDENLEISTSQSHDDDEECSNSTNKTRGSSRTGSDDDIDGSKVSIKRKQ